jgi:hypothetical protein
MRRNHPCLSDAESKGNTATGLTSQRHDHDFEEDNSCELQRQALVQKLRGKYSFIRTSSDDFALRKQDEIDRER